jgi:hypothetical protein
VFAAACRPSADLTVRRSKLIIRVSSLVGPDTRAAARVSGAANGFRAAYVRTAYPVGVFAEVSRGKKHAAESLKKWRESDPRDGGSRPPVNAGRRVTGRLEIMLPVEALRP